MKSQLLFYFIVVSWAIVSCSERPKTLAELNPAMPGFDTVNSDPGGIQLADSIMAAMGGRESWDKARFISWNFFGRRDLTWDKHTGRVRIEIPKDSIIFLVNINSGEGRARMKGTEITEPDSLKKLMARAKSIWINDSYWLVMPFKMKDSGVTLKYMGQDTVLNNRFNVLELRFNQVGDTPDNKYRVYVGIQDKLVKYWAYYNNAKQDTANFMRPWDNYKTYNGVLLSADRSDDGGPKNVKVEMEMPDKVFTEF